MGKCSKQNANAAPGVRYRWNTEYQYCEKVVKDKKVKQQSKEEIQADTKKEYDAQCKERSNKPACQIDANK